MDRIAVFFTTGAITRIVRGERWAAQLPLLEQYWQPFLESGSADGHERRAALEAVAERLLQE
jgi:hypothetical protein